jgi:hypothetical protein
MIRLLYYIDTIEKCIFQYWPQYPKPCNQEAKERRHFSDISKTDAKIPNPAIRRPRRKRIRREERRRGTRVP